MKLSNSQASLNALGRLKRGQLNKLELAYQDHLEALKIAGEVLWYKFEGIKLRLADNTHITIDFAVLDKNSVIELHEVKGFMREDANVKLKVAAEQFPFVIKLVKKGKSGSWVITEY